jgi:flagellar hook-basal body complex protein FliE
MPGPDSATAGSAAAPSGFFGTLTQALTDVSTAQGEATAAEAGFAAGVPGATLAKALVANDRAAVDWNATVAVRNELVAAYQSVMNMQF